MSRPLYIYVKNAHVGVIPGIKEFVAEYTSEEAFGDDGYLTERGLIPLAGRRARRGRAAVEAGVRDGRLPTDPDPRGAPGLAQRPGRPASHATRAPDVIGYLLLTILARRCVAYGVGQRWPRASPSPRAAATAFAAELPRRLCGALGRPAGAAPARCCGCSRGRVIEALLWRGPARRRSPRPPPAQSQLSSPRSTTSPPAAFRRAAPRSPPPPAARPLAGDRAHRAVRRRGGADAPRALFARTRLAPALPRPHGVERALRLLIAGSFIAVLTTIGIVVSLFFEAVRFFEVVPPRVPLRPAVEPQMAIRADQVRQLGGLRRRAAVHRHAADQPHRDGGRRCRSASSRRSTSPNTPAAEGARGGQAAARDPRRHPDRRLRLLRRADRGAAAARRRRRSASRWRPKAPSPPGSSWAS